MTVTLHPATADDLPALATADGRAFGLDYEPQDLEDLRLIIDPERFVLARSEGAIVGAAGSYALHVTPPGGARSRPRA
ncbi:GNAT family N-acetyltransferase [Pseudonocardia hydrocarbonoxydans]|uniref:N-acetyltransferase domain-containing protein n=1 Tax=Pseudonocardia hydrocarbonoxydans TaxID=76726 RepID=A0A4Y3WN35_9PSEU|nr:GNAT family N-acetyltransferase [Pseudonocardia hydrocarbonoxydans]GEC20194.1 hypothetical protein PHY01_24770 [Pseudonocardia hydrocarbonoxydans]